VTRASNAHADWKPIMDAAFVGDVKRVRKLLDAGVDPNTVSRTVHRYRPLHRAIELKKTTPRDQRHEAVVKLLLERGADPKLRGTIEKLTALQLAAFGETRFVPIVRRSFGTLDIFHAAALGDLSRVKRLLAKDCALARATDEMDWTALHMAAASRVHRGDARLARNLLEIVKLLLKRGADHSAPFYFEGKWPLRPLYFACGRSDNPAIAELLIEAGADPCDGESVYHAADDGHVECLAVIERLTDAKRLADECSMCLCNQMHWGRVRGRPWLLEHGAPPGGHCGSPATG
jgi:ankyrin repeat protein